MTRGSRTREKTVSGSAIWYGYKTSGIAGPRGGATGEVSAVGWSIVRRYPGAIRKFRFEGLARSLATIRDSLASANLRACIPTKPSSIFAANGVGQVWTLWASPLIQSLSSTCSRSPLRLTSQFRRGPQSIHTVGRTTPRSNSQWPNAHFWLTTAGRPITFLFRPVLFVQFSRARRSCYLLRTGALLL